MKKHQKILYVYKAISFSFIYIVLGLDLINYFKSEKNIYEDIAIFLVYFKLIFISAIALFFIFIKKFVPKENLEKFESAKINVYLVKGVIFEKLIIGTLLLLLILYLLYNF